MLNVQAELRFNISIDNFSLVRGDRTVESGKTGGGGVCLYVNKRWFHPNNVYRTNHICTPDVEILTVTIRPYYLPREFPKVTVNVVYAPPSGHDETAAHLLADTVNAQLTSSPDSVVFMTGDFNTCLTDPYLPQFEQYIDCFTRENKTLDKCYGNVKKAYKSKQLPNLGNSDHNMIELLPIYKPRIQTMPVEKKTIKVWDESGSERLRACFEITDWNVFYDSSSDLDELTDVITEYARFCEDVCLEKKKH